MPDFDPSPLFALSLFPYLFFFISSGKSGFPTLTRRGFQLTLLFVGVTIVAAVVADFRFDAELVAIDPLHGGAEAFLTLSNAVIVAGLIKPQRCSDEHPLREVGPRSRTAENGSLPLIFMLTPLLAIAPATVSWSPKKWAL